MVLLVSPRACFSTSGHRFDVQNLSSWGQEVEESTYRKRREPTLLTLEKHLGIPSAERAWAQTHLEKGSLLLSLQDRAKEQQSSATTEPGLLLPFFQCCLRTWETALSDKVKLSRCAQDQKDACCRFGVMVWQQLLPRRGFIPYSETLALTARDANPQPTQDPLEEQPHLSSLTKEG